MRGDLARALRGCRATRPNAAATPAAAAATTADGNKRSSGMEGLLSAYAEEGSDEEAEERLGESEVRKVREREEIRREQQKKRERELRMSHMGAEAKARHLAK